MGKVKKGKKLSKDEDIDEDIEIESTTSKNNKFKNKNEHDNQNNIEGLEETDENTKKKKNKKDKKNKKLEDDEDIEEASKESEDISKKEKDKKKKKISKSKSSPMPIDDSDSEESSQTHSGKAASGRSGFALLAPESDNEEPEQRNSSESEDNPKPAPTAKSKEKKSKKKKNRHASDDDDDLDRMLAELRLEYGQEETNTEGSLKGSKNESEDSKNTKKNKNEKSKNESLAKPEEAKPEENKNENNDEEYISTVKTAAQKKKEKKEKQKKLAQLKKTEEVSLNKQPSIETPSVDKNTETIEDTLTTKDVDEESVPAEDKKKKKKKGGKEETEKDDKKGKGPGKKTIAAMQDALKKLKEEEERLAREEEERIKKIEEAERVKEEQARLEKERKERKKQKEKERKDRLKAEGKLLTAKQKADRARAQAMIESLKAQGLMELPSERKPPASRARPGRKTKKDQQQEQQQPEPQKQEPEQPEQNLQEDEAEQVQLEIVEPSQEASKDTDDDVKDAWDADSDEEAREDKSELSKPEAKTSGSSEKTTNADGESDSNENTEESESESEESESSDEDGDDKKTDAERRRERALKRIQKRRADAEKERTPDDLRAAVVCVLGHVDTGKTKILDKLRRTNVQDGEAGGITQQIGATNVPVEAIQEQAKYVKDFKDTTIRLPGLLIIDTPGHESFSNLRSRGSSLCDIAILVVDIMHGLEPQTLESIQLLKSKKTPFIIALNKIDRLYQWQTMSRRDVRDIIKNQASNTQIEFEERTKQVIIEFAEQGLNAALFYENPDPRKYLSLVPTSAITGEGMGNLLALVVDSCQTMLTKRLMYSEELQATVLEVKALPGLGTTIDAILVNGRLREGDTVVIAGTDGPIVTQIRSLLMPQPLRELRVKSAYVEYKEIRAAQGVKIAAKELDKAIAGLNLLVAQHPDEVDILRDEVKKELRSALSHIKLSERGVYVQASTLGSLEALLDFLRTSKIPYSNVRIGPVAKRDVTKASAMLEHDSQYATILAFDVKVERDAQDLADSLSVRIFQADIIYHLFDAFTAYRNELIARRREQFKNIAVFPCRLRILPQYVFNSRDPIVIGVMVESGIVREGTPLCVPDRECVELGIVTSIESNHKTVETARKGLEVCIKIEPIPGEAPKMFGRHFDEKDLLVSKITRQSIDACKEHFRDDLIKADWQLMVELKKTFKIL